MASASDAPYIKFPQGDRSYGGCWTCRIRRKKCDERRPTCRICENLSITCHFDQQKPDWMDGGPRQEQMALELKRQVKEHAPFRRWNRNRDHSPNTRPSQLDDAHHLPQHPSRSVDCPLRQLGGFSGDTGPISRFGRHDTVLLSVYMDHVVPLLFPFYNPRPLQGGKSWILELFLSSPVFRQAVLCHSTYWMYQSSETPSHNAEEPILEQTQNCFQMLRGALEHINGAYISEHLHGSVRILASIVVMQRFEMETLRFENYRIHLSAALALYQSIIASQHDTGSSASDLSSTLIRAYNRLGPAAESRLQIPSAEQTALQFSVASLLVNDIIASTVSQEQPVLYDHCMHLLCDSAGNTNSSLVIVDLSITIGCQNWAFLSIAEIATLDAWKLRHKQAGTLDMVELFQRAALIKETIEKNMKRLLEQEARAQMTRETDLHQPTSTGSQVHIVTRIWANAALLYLSVVVSGWQPNSDEVRDSVHRVADLVALKLYPETLLRMVIWPVFVAGCLAGAGEVSRLRRALQEYSGGGVVKEALGMLERVWGSEHAVSDWGQCFRGLGHVVFLM